MDKIIEKLNKELEQIEVQIDDKGFTKEKLEITGRILEILKDAEEIKMMCDENKEWKDTEKEHHFDSYKDKPIKYDERKYPRGGYLKNYINRIDDGVEMYEDGKDRYQHGDNDHRMIEGLEKLMYGVCMLVESMLDFAESPQEKEVIRHHIRKLKNM